DGGARIVGGEVTLEGTWGGDVSVQAGRLAVGPEARIEGTLRYRVPAENVSIDPAAAVVGEVVPLQPRSPMNWRWLAAIWHIGFLAAGAVAVAVLPGFARASSGRLQARPGASAGLGLLWLVAVPVAALVAALTIVGIPLALILFALYLIVVYLARSVVAVWLGDQVLRDRASVGRGGMVVRFLAGGVMLG